MKKDNTSERTRKMVFISVLVAQGIILSFIERMLPVPFIAPGAKLGLANIVSLTAIYMLSFKEAAAVVVLRIIITAVTFGSLSSFFYSLSGGILSFFVMFFMTRVFKNNVSLMGVSIIGAVAHNLGQLLVAAFVVNTFLLVTTYLPILMIAAIPTGLFVGVVARFLINYLERIHFKR